MEKTDIGVVIPLNAYWSDVGNWKSLWENEEIFNHRAKMCTLASKGEWSKELEKKS